MLLLVIFPVCDDIFQVFFRNLSERARQKHFDILLTDQLRFVKVTCDMFKSLLCLNGTIWNVIHHITSHVARKTTGQLKKSVRWHHHGLSSNERCKITERSCNNNFKIDCIKDEYVGIKKVHVTVQNYSMLW